MLLNKILGFFIFTFNLIVTISSFIFIFKQLNYIFTHFFFILIFIFFFIFNIITWYFSFGILIKKQIQNYLGYIQLSGLFTILYHCIYILLIYLTYQNNKTTEIEIFLFLGIISIISNIILCLINYGYKEEFLNYNYDIEQNKQIEQESYVENNNLEKCNGELSISIQNDNEYETYYPSAPPLEENEFN